MTDDDVVEAVARAVCRHIRPWIDSPGIKYEGCHCVGTKLHPGYDEIMTGCMVVMNAVAKDAITAYRAAMRERGVVEAPKEPDWEMSASGGLIDSDVDAELANKIYRAMLAAIPKDKL